MYNKDISRQDTFICFGPSSTTASTTTVHIFNRDANKCLFGVLAAGGGGGSSGWSDAAGSTTTPGGGGGAANGGFFFSPSYLLPGCLTVSVGGGGAGGAGARIASNGGVDGTPTEIYVNRTNTRLWATGQPTGATAATTGAAGVGGSVGTLITAGIFNPGISRAPASTAGVGGNTTTTGTSQSSVASFISGGAGGGGITNTNISRAGGGIPDAGIDIGVPGVVGATPSITTNHLFDPLIQNSSRGGAGGGSVSGAVGANGTNGGYGSGGGGGGGSNSAASNGGSGGNGGPGFAILIEI